jgi:SAM-dependent methyltransferase
MNHKDHVDLLRAGVLSSVGVWADLGCGTGAFTLALAELLDPQSVTYAVDTDRHALSELSRRCRARFPSHDIRPVQADFTQPLDLPPLDGVVMANSLHFHREKEPIVRAVRHLLKPSGRLVLIEYNVDRGNPWVPFPISYSKWRELALRCGFASTESIAAKPSSFLREIYSSVSQLRAG